MYYYYRKIGSYPPRSRYPLYILYVLIIPIPICKVNARRKRKNNDAIASLRASTIQTIAYIHKYAHKRNRGLVLYLHVFYV